MALDEMLTRFRQRLNNGLYDHLSPVSDGIAQLLTVNYRPRRALEIGAAFTFLYFFSGCGGSSGGGGNGNGKTYQCNNNKDDDGDGLVDMADPGCTSTTDNDEYNAPANNPPVINAVFSPVSTPEDNPTAVAGVSSHFSDPDGDTLTYSVQGFTNIAAALSGNNINISAPANWNGTETGNIKACDPSNACVSTPLGVTFTPVNDAPVISGVTMYSAIEGAALDGIVNTSDIELDTVTCTLLNNGGLTQLQVNNDCTITSAAPLLYNTSGSYTASVQASDGVGGVTTGDVQIDIVNVNRKPVVTSVTITTAQEEMALAGYVNRTDADGDATTCELVSSDIEAEVAPNGTVYSCTALPCDPLAPDTLPRGAGGNSRTLEVRCTDGFEVSDNFTRNFRVEGFPVLVSAIPNQSTPEDVNGVLDIVSYFSDPNNDSLIYSVQGLSTISASVSGSVITFSAPLNYNGSETAQIRACDPLGLCVSDNVLVTFTPVNDAPAVNGVTMYSSIEGEFLDGVVNTSDVDGDAVTCSEVNDGGLTELVINSDCSISSIAALPYTRSGTYNVTVRANDGTLNTDGIVQITVADNTPANNPPVVTLAFAPVSTPEESATSVSVLGHFSDPDLDPLTYTVSGFATITAVLSGTDINISAPVNYNSTETGLVTACDPAPACVSTPLQVTYTPINDMPQIIGLSMSISQEGAYLDGVINVNDVDGDPVSCHLSSHGGLVELIINSNCTVTSSVPLPYDRAGTYDIQLWAEDPSGGTPNATLPLNVANVNRAPNITDVVFDFVEEGVFLIGGINGNDPDGDSVTCYLVSSNLPELKVSSGCGVYSDAPLPPAAQVNYNVVVGMTDGSLEDTFSRDFEVQRPPTTPSAVCGSPPSPCGPNFGVFETGYTTFTLISTDPNGDPITYTSTALPTGMSFNPTTGLVEWTPACDQGGNPFTSYGIGFIAKDTKNAESGLYTVDIAVIDFCPP